MAEVLGTFYCDCCCSSEVEHNDHGTTAGHMRCTGCNCTRIRRGSATQILLRVQIAGAPSLEHLERAAELARLLGGPDDAELVRAETAVHYFEIPGAGAVNALEIARLRRG